jgi:transcriptional regulator with XRE-family HTH domain
MPSRIKRRPSVFSPAKLRALREKRGVDIEEAARLCSQATGQKLSSRMWRYAEKGQSSPGADRLCAIADYFGVPIAALFEERVSRRATPKRIGVGSASAVSAGTVPEPAAKTSKGQS